MPGKKRDLEVIGEPNRRRTRKNREGQGKGAPMTYKRLSENIATAMYFGHSYNKYDRLEFDEASGVLTGYKVFIGEGGKLKVQPMFRFTLGTGCFEALYWGHKRTIKASVGNYMTEIMAVFEVNEVRGPDAFHKLWDPRLDSRNKLRKVQRKYRRK